MIFTLHGIGEPPEAGNEWVPVEWLEAVLDALPPSGVRLTFDDGWASDLDVALPLLQRKGVVAQFFILVGVLGQPGRLTADAVRTLHREGMEIGSHGIDHLDWRQAPRAALERELAGSRRMLAELTACEVDEVSCPYGSYDRRVLRQARAAGYKRIYVGEHNISSELGEWLSPRTTIDRGTPLERWLAMVAAGPGPRPGAAMRARRWVRRMR